MVAADETIRHDGHGRMVRDDSTRSWNELRRPASSSTPVTVGIDPIMVVTPLRHGGSMSATTVDVQDLHLVGDVVGRHACPVCAAPVVEVYRPGRARLYCTNACRQRAYRWRRAHGVRMFVQRDGAAERSLNDRRHALRDRRDPVARLTDRRQREVTVCGTFARPVRDMRVTHDRFVPEHPWSCLSCAALIGAGPPGTGIPDVVAAYAGGLGAWGGRPVPDSRRWTANHRSP